MKEPRQSSISVALLEHARRADDGDVSPGVNRRGRDKLAAALAGRSRSPARRWAPSLAFAAAVATLLVVAVGWSRLRFDVTGAVVTTAGYVSASKAEPAAIAFSDGTRVEVGPSSAVRVARAGLRGADLVQERGRATYAVVHRPAAAWSVEAGPYRVLVTGTRFSVAWAPEPGELITELYEGSVVIEGPRAEGGVVLHAGQRLRASIGGSVVVEDMPSSPAASSTTSSLGSAPSEIPAAVAAEAPVDTAIAPVDPAASPAGSANPAASPAGVPGAPPASAQAAVAAPEPRLSLGARLAQGDATGIADDVEREGMASFTDRASAGDLVIVADAARYARRPALATAAFNALRRRHPGTREAALAAFHLGRAADGANPAGAVAWYDLYLAETGGSGPFASEVRGRQMSAVARASGNAAARPLAEAYLARLPNGPYAQLARAILAAP